MRKCIVYFLIFILASCATPQTGDGIKGKIDVITKNKLKITETLIPKIDNLSSYNLPIANSALAENRNNNVMRFLNFILSKNYE